MEVRANKKTRMDEYFPLIHKVNAYGGDLFSEENVQATRQLAFKLLAESRARKNVSDEKDYLFMRKNSSLLPNFRDTMTYEDSSGSVMLFEIPWSTIGAEERPQEVLFLWKQFDGTSCPGSVLLTCTAGFTNVDAARVLRITSQLNTEDNNWAIVREEVDSLTGRVQKVSKDFEHLMPVEGMARLIYDSVGILPCIFFGRVAQEIIPNVFEELERDDNMFQDERFQKIMRIVRFASICTWNGVHWYSLVCVPTGPKVEDAAYIVFNSMDRLEQNVYPTYRAFRRYFLLEKTAVDPQYPLTVAIYPVLQKQEDADPRTANFMQLVMERAMKNMEDDCQPFVDWKTIASVIDETE